ncbi:diacylglycerol kinase family protein [Kurthia senegalensis]|uniref:diacylglycerol kinase family protein n=1 Tax=Kurthia senegalensis TaxID=1033740 RepID=UPI00028A07B9|nr:diacylglycerol kinase family protein [Kurthia senegalensis]
MNVTKFIRSFRYALSGMRQATAEQNFRVDIIAAIVVLVVSFLTKLSLLEWVIIIMLIAGMLALEMMNSAVERVVDLVTSDYHPLAKAAKDIAAGAVFIYAIAAVVIACFIFLPKWL